MKRTTPIAIVALLGLLLATGHAQLTPKTNPPPAASVRILESMQSQILAILAETEEALNHWQGTSEETSQAWSNTLALVRTLSDQAETLGRQASAQRAYVLTLQNKHKWLSEDLQRMEELRKKLLQPTDPQ